MPARSHVDTWMFIKFINLDEDDIDASISPDSLHRRDKTQLLEIYDTQYNRSKALIFHETYHLWQGVRACWGFLRADFEILTQIELPHAD